MVRLAFTFVAAWLARTAADVRIVTVNCTGDACVEISPDASTFHAKVAYNRTANETSGFASLDIDTPEVGTPAEQRTAYYAAGFAEGLATATEMAKFYTNVYEFGSEGPSESLVAFVEENDRWVRLQAKLKSGTSDYWNAVSMTLAQFDGLLAGYNEAATQDEGLPGLTKLQLLWVNLDGDLFDLQTAVGDAEPLAGRQGRARRLERPEEEYPEALRCSALFKLTDDNDLFFGHDTWDTYATAAPRIWKHSRLPVRMEGSFASRMISFSSSPGFIASVDDYYVVDSSDVSLVVIETSLGIK